MNAEKRIRFGIAAAALVCAGAWGCGKGPEAPPPYPPPPLEGEAAPAARPASDEPQVSYSGPGVVADFEVIGEFNNRGGKYGAWFSNAPDPKGECATGLATPGEKSGSALKITFDISAGEGARSAYAGLWMHLVSLDARPFQKLVMMVKAEGAGPDFFVELKDSGARNVARAKATGVGAEWTRVEIPLVSFGAIPDTSALAELAFVFDGNVSNPRKGTYWIDNIRLE